MKTATLKRNTTTKINREEFLQCLESVESGLSNASIEQSSCVVFRRGRAYTFNEEVACSAKTGLDKSFEGAVKAVPLINILRKLSEDELDVVVEPSHMLLKGKNRRVEVFLEKEISLPLDMIEKAEGWSALPADFSDAVNTVQHCASKKVTPELGKYCLHFHSKWIEACDGKQLCRWKMQTGIKEPFLVRRTTINPVVSLGMTEFSETNNWVHFRNATGLVLSCRRYLEPFPDLTEVMDVQGEDLTLPKGFANATSIAQIYSSENEMDYVKVQLKPDRIKIIGEGVSGRYYEWRKSNYKGKPLSFLIAPEILSDLIERHNECVISKDRLKVNGGGTYCFVVRLHSPEGQGSEAKTGEEE